MSGVECTYCQAEVARVQAATRAMVLAPTYACTSCGRYAFPQFGVQCYWCAKSARAAA